MSETHGRLESPTTLVPPPGYSLLETVRGGRDKQGGGLLLAYRSTLNAHHWIPSVDSSKAYVANERQWLLVQGDGGLKVAVLSCYLACQRRDHDQFISWNQDLYSLMAHECQVLKSQHYQILAMGDFNARVGRHIQTLSLQGTRLAWCYPTCWTKDRWC